VTDDRIIELFARYRAAYEAGAAPDMAAALAAAGDDSDALAAVLEDYHAVTPAPLDLDAIARLAASPAFAPTFGEALRAAWTRQGMLRRVLVDRLLAELGLRVEARGYLDERLHAVEVGRHPAAVSRRLLEALERVLPGVSDALASTGGSTPLPAAPAIRFNRVAALTGADGDEWTEERRAVSGAAPRFPEVDALFQAD